MSQYIGRWDLAHHIVDSVQRLEVQIISGLNSHLHSANKAFSVNVEIIILVFLSILWAMLEEIIPDLNSWRCLAWDEECCQYNRCIHRTNLGIIIWLKGRGSSPETRLLYFEWLRARNVVKKHNPRVKLAQKLKSLSRQKLVS